MKSPQNITLINQSQMRMPRQFILTWLRVLIPLLSKLGVRRKKTLMAELTIVFVNPSSSRKLNSRYRKKNKPTDVLSFHPGDDISQSILGELVICPQVIERQAKDQSLTFRQELSLMLTHGVLHLLGYDHEVDKIEERLMFELQDRVWHQCWRSLQNELT